MGLVLAVVGGVLALHEEPRSGSDAVRCPTTRPVWGWDFRHLTADLSNNV